jgi:arylsulfatase A-like enzyme
MIKQHLTKVAKYSLCTVLATTAMPLFAQSQDKPNVIIFLVDDMGLMDTSLPFLTDETGKPERHPLNDWYRTPNMERLAAQGVQLSKFYAQSVSSPSRSSIQTGKNATRHRTTNWIQPEANNRNTFGPNEWNWEGLNKDDITLPKLMKQAGYKTIHVGKAHFGPKGSVGENPCNLGYDTNIGGSSIGHPGSYYGEEGYGHIKGQKTRAVDGLEKYHGTDTHLTKALTIEANNEITKAVEAKEPFFLNLAHYAVHSPFQADKRFANNYPISADKPKTAQAFASLIEGMDQSLGEVMDHLEKLGVSENTLIIFLGDNGSDAPLGSIDGHFSSAPLRGKKGGIYEGGVRIPFIAAWAKNNPESSSQRKHPIAKGEILQERSSIMDIFPTVLELADIKNPKDNKIDGSDLWKIFDGRKDNKHKTNILMHFPHAHRGNYFTTYIDGDWKVIYHYNPEHPTQPKYELYNLTNDPYENKDLSKENSKVLAKMVKKMASQLEKEDAVYPIDANSKTLKPIIPSK